MAKLRVLTKEERIRRAWAALRAERNRRLADADWIVVRAYERGEPVPEEWANYRQALRDLPGILTDEQVLAGDVPWPVRPDETTKEKIGGGAP
ncbi:phage tail assembly chaperone [Thermus brockianus]|uniref:Phage tail assembly chaperone-like domain-containing protein n=1 Tax=Thermus brockianus TaxID=56956 RepID=A0A1J0LTN2_THEBO|nr:phage tail assembly chaperone [Thermus brockianus]APD09761.1 hypothetical protein A0O31_01653 [Thermus brockianus]